MMMMIMMMMMMMIVFGCCICVDYIANDKLAKQDDVAQCPINVLMFLHLKTATDVQFKNTSCT